MKATEERYKIVIEGVDDEDYDFLALTTDQLSLLNYLTEDLDYPIVWKHFDDVEFGIV